MILERRHFELEDQQRHHDGKYAVAEGLDAGETQLALFEPIEQVHAKFRCGIVGGIKHWFYGGAKSTTTQKPTHRKTGRMHQLRSRTGCRPAKRQRRHWKWKRSATPK